MDNVPIKYYYDFLGLGYIAYSVSNFILIFGNKEEAVNIWKKTVKSWKTEKIKVWFIESADTYDFIMHGESSKNKDANWVFCKTLEISENYKRFMDRYIDVAELLFGVYTPENKSSPIKLLGFRKKVKNVKFLTESEVDEDSIVEEAMHILHKKNIKSV